MKTVAAAILLAVASMIAPAIANADFGDPGQTACTGPVPIPDQVAAIINELTDPNIPAVNKGDIVTVKGGPGAGYTRFRLVGAIAVAGGYAQLKLRSD